MEPNQSPREAWERLVRTVQQRAQQQGGGRMPGGGTPRGLIGGGAALLLLGGIALTANNALFNVDGGHRAIKYTRLGGVKQEIYAEGTHFMLPWFETPITYDVRARPRNVASLTGTKDLQMVNITCRVLSLLKSVVAQFNASQLITQRESVSRLVRDNLVKRAARFNILLDDVSLTHLAFSPEFTAAVEAKQVAQQEAQRAAFVVDRARQEKQAMVVRAQGEARSAELIGEAVKKSKSYIELRKIENAKTIAQLLMEAGGRNKVYLDAEGLGLNVYDVLKDKDQRK
ncbi:Prohibitin-2 [Dactylellina cionopaga]|nr:Prohibitin-2 [Dactylellina cionopaga]